MPTRTFVILALTWTMVCISLGNTASAQESEAAPVAPADTSGRTTKTAAEQRESYLKKNPSQARDISLFFDPVRNKVELPKQIIEYDLSLGNLLKIGSLSLTTSSLQIDSTRDLALGESLDLSGAANEATDQQILTFTWPLDYMINGKLELLDDANKAFWSYDLKIEDVFKWVTDLENRIPAGDRKARKDFLHDLEDFVPFYNQRGARDEANQQMAKKDVWISSFGLVGKNIEQVPFASMQKPFRFCLTQESETGRLAMCSQRYRAIGTAAKFQLKTSSRYFQPKVMVNDQELTLRGTAVFLDNKTRIKFAALLSDGSYYEFISGPKPVNIIDMVYSDDKKDVEVIGWGNPPIGRVEVIRRESRDFWDFLNFMPTIGDFRNFWRAKFDVNQPYLYLRGFGGAPFKQEFIFQDLPMNKHRMYISQKSPTSTYSETVKLDGVKVNKKMAVASKQKKVKSFPNGSFQWDFLSKKKNVYNRSYLQVKDGDKIWNAYYEVYRGAPRETALRGNFVVTSDSALILMGEIGAQYWFEDVFGSDSYFFSKQRWGVNARYFQSVTTIEMQKKKTNGVEDKNEFALAVADANLKYRFSRGVWAQDATVGLMGSVQYVDYKDKDGFKFDPFLMMGGGVFWARSMPRFFDDIFNIIPFLRYPKWVNADFIWYPLSLDSSKTPVFNFALNFYGKVRWSANFFGEAGFGIKNYAWEDTKAGTSGKKTQFALAYTTLGLGYNF